MLKERFNNLKLKFTDGKGNYIFPVPVIEMEAADLRDYIDYLKEKWSKAQYFADLNYSFKSMGNANAKYVEYVNVLTLVKINRKDFKLSDKELEIERLKW